MNYTDQTWEEEILDAAGLQYAEEPTRENIARVNKEMRKVDQSHLFPIRGKFNGTDRAIDRIGKYRRDGGTVETIGAYVALVDQQIGIIVNDPRSL